MPSTPSAFGPYAVVEALAARAFTVTYRAEHRRIGRAVLVKALKPTVSIDSPFAADLEREAAVLGRLDHEGAVRLHELAREGGAVYLVLEDPGGVSLEAVLGAARLDVDPALALGLSLARAVGHAHERGVVHRGLSPEGVAVTPAGRVLVVDFSSAIVAGDAEPGERSESPRPPSYLAPEQILGEPATPRSDVWALGVLLHEALAGARPWGADEPRQLASRIRTEPPAPLPSAVPAPIARIVTRCLSKDPDDRYPDARALAAAVEEALAGRTRLPVPVLVTRALAAAHLGEALPPPAGLSAVEPPRAPPGPDVRGAARGLAVVLAVLLAGTVSLRLLATGDEGAPGDGVPEPAVAGARDRGFVRVVARPWAEVFLDGELVDTTPIGRPIPVLPGKHFVTFRHPAAADEQRSIKVVAGQTVFLDVSMRVPRSDAGAPRPDAGPPPSVSP